MELYVNSGTGEAGSFTTGGNDTSDGLSYDTPKATIRAAIETLDMPVTEDVTIHLARSGVDYIYDGSEPEDGMDMKDLIILGDGKIHFRADWSEDFNLMDSSTYPSGMETEDAYTLELPRLPKVEAGRNGCFEFFGVEIAVESSETSVAVSSILATKVDLSSCRIKGATFGLNTLRSHSLVSNTLFQDNQIGIFAVDAATVLLAGKNIISNAMEVGLYVGGNGGAMMGPFTGGDIAELEIVTTYPREDYIAVKAVAHGQIVLDAVVPGFEQPLPGIIRIIRDSEYDNDEYRGVVIESGSLIMGARNVSFKKPAEQFESTALIDDSDTIPESRQFIVATEQGAVAIE